VHTATESLCIGAVERVPQLSVDDKYISLYSVITDESRVILFRFRGHSDVIVMFAWDHVNAVRRQGRIRADFRWSKHTAANRKDLGSRYCEVKEFSTFT
jgi:hypothetical protein